MHQRVTSKGHYLGWRRDSIGESRDFVYAAPHRLLKAGLPATLSLRNSLSNPPIYDQGEIGSCAANATARLVQFVRRKSGESPDWMPSRLFLYYDVRAIERTIPYDAGAELRDVVRTLSRQGVCSEILWPYVIAPADDQGVFPSASAEVMLPPRTAYTDASRHRSIVYSRLMCNLWQMRGCIADGFPFMFGFAVYSSIYGADGNPVVDLPMPGPNDQQEGWHAITCVGYDDTRKMPDGSVGALEIANSWGPTVQDSGYFWMPYSYATDANLAADFWTIRRISS
jgi:C1A family cysteine protease